ncbi:hypothetical protein RFI_18271, partial [Reticulomyxa filosa]
DWYKKEERLQNQARNEDESKMKKEKTGNSPRKQIGGTPKHDKWNEAMKGEVSECVQTDFMTCKQDWDYLLDGVLEQSIRKLVTLDLSSCDKSELDSFRSLSLEMAPRSPNKNSSHTDQIFRQWILDANGSRTVFRDSKRNLGDMRARECLVFQIVSFFKFVVDVIFQLGLHYNPKFFSIMAEIFNHQHSLYIPNMTRTFPMDKDTVMMNIMGNWIVNDESVLDKIHFMYLHLVEYFGSIGGFQLLLMAINQDTQSNKTRPSLSHTPTSNPESQTRVNEEQLVHINNFFTYVIHYLDQSQKYWVLEQLFE